MKSAWEALHGSVRDWYAQHQTLAGYFSDGPAFEAEVLRMFRALAEHDRATALHSQRVARYAGWLGHELGLDRLAAEQLRLAALLHDVGKLCVPRHLLGRAGQLPLAEHQLVQEHAAFGARLMHALTPCPAVQQAVRWHHERPDGQGYPDRLRGAAIPLFARIIAIAGAFDALTSPRLPTQELPWHEALQEMHRGAGRQFDPALVEAFAALVRRHLPPKAAGAAPRVRASL